MTVHHFHTELWVPAKRDAVFAFFADARNLQAITPEWLDFRIVTPEPITMQPGALIDYRLKLRGWPVSWQTRIALWDPPRGFMDEQLRGPYRLWQHTHTFEEQAGGTLCRDIVRYAVPGGRIVNWLLVRRDVERIFSYRQEKMRQQFPGVSPVHTVQSPDPADRFHRTQEENSQARSGFTPHPTQPENRSHEFSARA